MLLPPIDLRLLISTLMVLMFASAADAATVHHWRFESSPGFTVDSVGSATLTPEPTISQVALPGSGRGSEIASALPGNASAMDSTGAGRMTHPSFFDPEFTIEAFIHWDVPQQGSLGDTIATVGDGQSNVTIAWLFQIRSSELSMAFCDGAACGFTLSGVPMLTGKDYFVAASVDLPGGTIDLHFQNLTDGGTLQTVSDTHTYSTLNSPLLFSIGASSEGGLGFDGLIDEVRYSDHARMPSELLINGFSPPVVPGAETVPALGSIAAVLLACGLAAAGARRIRS